MNVEKVKEGLNTILELSQKNKFEEALKLTLELLEVYPYSVELLIWKGMLIQDIPDESKFNKLTLQDSYDSLILASKFAGNLSAEPELELGNYEWIFNDDAKKALEYYNSAYSVAARRLKGILIGMIKCNIAIDNKGKAKKIWKKTKIFYPNDDLIKELERELGESFDDINEALKNPNKAYQVYYNDNKDIIDQKDKKKFLPLKKIPPEIKKLTNLIVLWLCGNLLQELPPEIGELKKLQDMNISNNSLSSIPPEIGKLNNLTHLNLSKNHLTFLPTEIGQLENIRFFYLNDNKLSFIPDEIKHLDKLQFLDIKGNPLSNEAKDKIRRLLPNCKIII